MTILSDIVFPFLSHKIMVIDKLMYNTILYNITYHHKMVYIKDVGNSKIQLSGVDKYRYKIQLSLERSL